MNTGISSTVFNKDDFLRSSVRESDYQSWLSDFFEDPRISRSQINFPDLESVDGVIEALTSNQNFIRETEGLLVKLRGNPEEFINVGEKYKEMYE
jgi:hypothetical protein